MRTQFHTTTQLGELVAAAFDEAELYARDPEEASDLAAKAVLHMLRHARGNKFPILPPLRRLRPPYRGV